MVTATGTTPTDSPRTSFGLPSVEEATDRMRSLVEEMVASSKKVGLDVVDAQEKALQGLVALERKIPTARHLGWVSIEDIRDLLHLLGERAIRATLAVRKRASSYDPRAAVTHDSNEL